MVNYFSIRQTVIFLILSHGITSRTFNLNIYCNLLFNDKLDIVLYVRVVEMSVPVLVSCEWLQEQLQSGSHGDLVVIDVSWSSTKNCREEYNK